MTFGDTKTITLSFVEYRMLIAVLKMPKDDNGMSNELLEIVAEEEDKK